MRPLTLKSICKITEKNLLQLKLMLIKSQKKGELFIGDEIAILLPDEHLEMYLFLAPPRYQRNAFPVPKSYFDDLTNDSLVDHAQFKRYYFHQYYHADVAFHEDEFYMSFDKKYESEKCFWYYRIL